MAWFFYNFLIRSLAFGLRIHSLFDTKSKLAISGREVPINLPPKTKQRLWVHCASLGEFEQAKPIIEKTKSKIDCELILTFFSPSGYEIKKDYGLADFVCYLPFDLPRKVSEFLEEVKPDFVVFVKYEFWWNFIRAINLGEIPFIFVSASFRPDQYFFNWYAKPLVEELKKVTKLFVIKEDSRKLLVKNGFANVLLGGDNRIESISSRKLNRHPIQIIKEFKAKSPLLIFGSTYPVDHSEIIKIADDLIEEFQILIFPHDINLKEINRTQTALGKKCQLYSEIENGHPFTGYNILIVDKIGLLADAYQYADLAYIGGGFNNGIHNILEAFVYKIPIVFGPKHMKFEEAIFLKKHNFAKSIEEIQETKAALELVYRLSDQSEIESAFEHIFNKDEFGSDKIVNLICETI